MVFVFESADPKVEKCAAVEACCFTAVGALGLGSWVYVEWITPFLELESEKDAWNSDFGSSPEIAAIQVEALNAKP